MKNAIHGSAALAFFFAATSPAAQDVSQVSVARTSSESAPTHFKGRTFTPHVGISARTSDPGEVALQRNPGANLNTNFLIGTALTVAPASNIEIGTSLLYWLAPQHDWNALAKIGVYRSDVLDIALGAAASEWVIETNRLSIQSTLLGVNWKPRNSRVWWGLVGGVTRSVYSWGEYTQILREYGVIDADKVAHWSPEFGADASLALGPTDLTFGVGRLRNMGFSSFEPTVWSAGATVAWYRPGRFLSKPAVGVHYTPSARAYEILFSTRFY